MSIGTVIQIQDDYSMCVYYYDTQLKKVVSSRQYNQREGYDLIKRHQSYSRLVKHMHSEYENKSQ